MPGQLAGRAELGASLSSPLGHASYEFGVLDKEARQTIHIAHRLGALTTALLVGAFALALLCQRPPERVWLVVAGSADRADCLGIGERPSGPAAGQRPCTQLGGRPPAGLLCAGARETLYASSQPRAIPWDGQEPDMNGRVRAQRFALRRVRDYCQLTKPKVVALLLLTAWVGMLLAEPTRASLDEMILGLAGIGLLAAGAAAMNHSLDSGIDARMRRTRWRPVATGRITPGQAMSFAICLALSGFVLLHWGVNPLTAWLTLASLFGYAVVYTLLLKRATPQNIVIGGLAGAMPPLLGWTSITGQLSAEPWLLVMIIFTWTPPHFWSLAIHRRDDYAGADIPMLPVTHGTDFTKTAILLYLLILTLVCLLPYLIGMSGLVYLVGSLGLNLGFCWHGWLLKSGDRPGQAMRTFRFSIYHLMLLFGLLILDHHWLWRLS